MTAEPSTQPRVFGTASPAPLTELSIATAALRFAAADPGRTAVVDGATRHRLSRGELADLSGAVAANLSARGIGRGDLVALVMPNSVWWPVLALGVWRSGAAIVAGNPRWTPTEAARLMARVRPRLVLGTGDEPLEELLATPAGNPFAEPDAGPRDLAAILFSSGTGGLVKGVRLTHGSLAAAAAQFAATLGFREDTISLAAAPMFHIMGLGVALCAPLGAGSSLVTVPAPETRRILDLVEEHGVTLANVPVPVLTEIAEGAHSGAGTLELVVTGGAHVPPETQLRAEEVLGCIVRQGYGMTEAAPISVPRGGRGDPATVGWLVPGTEARLVDPHTGCDVPPGEPGELLVRGPQVMEGYHDDPDATAAAFADGWLRTGDLVEIRDDGQVVVGDRLKELIKVDGRSVAPAELELVMREHDAVRDAAVVGRPHPTHGEVPIGFVVLGRPVLREELMSWVGSRVTSYKRLHELHVVDGLPRTPTGKLVRSRLPVSS